MINVVSFSGGRTSAYLCHLMKEKYGDDVAFVFCDTGAEHPKTYDFIRKVNHELRLNLVCLRADITQEMGIRTGYKVVSIDDIGPDLKPFRDLVAKYGVPYYPNGRQCTGMMKTAPFIEYCDEQFGKGQYINWLGIRADEPRRLNPKSGVRYLADISDFEKQDVLNWWAKKDYDLECPEWLGNCAFCIQKKVSKVALAAIDEPEMANDFINMVDESARRKDGKKYDSMYETGLSLKQIRDNFELFDRDHVMQLVVRGRRLDTGSCSESCEPFSDQGELFGLEYK